MKFLVVDDAPDIVEAVNLCLELQYPDSIFLHAADGKTGLELAKEERPDLVVLDIGLPDLDGFEICRQIRADSDVPIVMLSVRDSDLDVARGLAVGADDYMTKPFSHIEFLARVRAILRRTRIGEGPTQGSITAGNVYLNCATREVRVNGESVRLTSTEFRLFYELVHEVGKVLTHRELLTRVWGHELAAKTGYLKVHIQHLRQKLGDPAFAPRMILTEPGVGYLFVTHPEGAK